MVSDVDLEGAFLSNGIVALQSISDHSQIRRKCVHIVRPSLDKAYFKH